jgi:glycosyltransferase involved in cell wall biosynthesis
LKFLLINQTFVPDAASSGQHLADLSVELARRGHDVTVVTSRRAYTDSRQRLAANETWRGVRVIRVGSFGFGHGSLWGRLLDAVSFVGLACARTCFLPRPDVIVTLTSPPLISVLGLCLARARRSRFVYWVMDLNPDEAFAAGWLRAGSPIGALLEWLSRASLRKADRVIVLDRFMLRRVADKGVSCSRIAIVPPWSHDSEVWFDIKGRKRFRQRHGLADKFVVMYSGNHSICHPLDTVLEAARLLEANPDIVFCFVGGGAQFARIEQLAERARDGARGGGGAGPRIICLPYQRLNELGASLSAADVQLVVMGERFVGIVHPCKIYNLLRLPMPIIYVGPKPSPITEILDQETEGQRAGLSHGDAEGLAREIRRLWRESCEGKRSWEIASRFSRDTVLPRVVAELEE